MALEAHTLGKEWRQTFLYIHIEFSLRRSHITQYTTNARSCCLPSKHMKETDPVSDTPHIYGMEHTQCYMLWVGQCATHALHCTPYCAPVIGKGEYVCVCVVCLPRALSSTQCVCVLCTSFDMEQGRQRQIRQQGLCCRRSGSFGLVWLSFVGAALSLQKSPAKTSYLCFAMGVCVCRFAYTLLFLEQ